MELVDLVQDFAVAIERVDSRRPVALNARSKEPYQPGIGPHPEAQTVALAMADLVEADPGVYATHEQGVPYPDEPRQKCDLCLGTPPDWDWAVEIKMIRMLGDNGKPNDNLPTHILSPYPQHRSALTDCEKLIGSGLGQRQAILIYGYDSDVYPLEALVAAFEVLASHRIRFGEPVSAEFEGLVHPVHQRGAVVAWELLA